jgi:hypothetical protein
VKAAHFEDRNVTPLSRTLGDIFEKLAGLVAPRAHLPTHDDLAVLTAQIDGELLAMQIDSVIQHE